MSLVQGSHGWNESDDVIVRVRFPHAFFHPRDCPNDFHERGSLAHLAEITDCGWREG